MENSVKQRLIYFVNAKQISIREFERSIFVSNGYVKSISKGIGVDILRRIIDTYPELNTEWLLYGEGEMLNDPAELQEQTAPFRSYTTGRPYYNVDFTLGFDIMANDQTANPEYNIDFRPYNDCDCWCNAHGNSMHPTISSGDIIALRRIPDPSILINGEIYAIVTANGLRTIKRIRDNGTTITLIADNPAIPDQTIRKNLVTHVYQVRGTLKQF